MKPEPMSQRHAVRVSPVRQRGIALVTSLLILVIVTLLALSMYRSVDIQEKIAGNTMEKQRSLQAAESALRYGEWWIDLGHAGTGIDCIGTVDGNNVANMRTCAVPLSSPGTKPLPWAGAISYIPPGLIVPTGGNGGLAASGDVNYANTPNLHIAYLGMGPSGKSMVYQVTGGASGGRGTTVSVVQSTYAMTARTVDLSGP